ncbi:MAG: hypothetical protein AAF408_01995 [Pseudomonadota bacterium]
MRLTFTSYLVYMLLAGIASASERPQVSDVVASYQAAAVENCPKETDEFIRVRPDYWAKLSDAESHEGAWYRVWPMNDAERQAGALAFVFAANATDLNSVKTALIEKVEEPNGRHSEAEFGIHVDRTLAGLRLLQCLWPSEDQIALIRDARLYTEITKTVQAVSCYNWFEAEERILELSWTHDEPRKAVMEILEDTVGGCPEGSS